MLVVSGHSADDISEPGVLSGEDEDTSFEDFRASRRIFLAFLLDIGWVLSGVPSAAASSAFRFGVCLAFFSPAAAPVGSLSSGTYEMGQHWFFQCLRTNSRLKFQIPEVSRH